MAAVCAGCGKRLPVDATACTGCGRLVQGRATVSLPPVWPVAIRSPAPSGSTPISPLPPNAPHLFGLAMPSFRPGGNRFISEPPDEEQQHISLNPAQGSRLAYERMTAFGRSFSIDPSSQPPASIDLASWPSPVFKKAEPGPGIVAGMAPGIAHGMKGLAPPRLPGAAMLLTSDARCAKCGGADPDIFDARLGQWHHRDCDVRDGDLTPTHRLFLLLLVVPFGFFFPAALAATIPYYAHRERRPRWSEAWLRQVWIAFGIGCALWAVLLLLYWLRGPSEAVP